MRPEITTLWSDFRYSAGNQTPDVAEMYLQLSQPSKIQNTTNRLVDYVLACVNNPRNDIDNPIRYCINSFHAANSAVLASRIIGDISKTSSLTLAKELLEKALDFVNSPPDVWKWVLTNIPSEEYFVLAYMNGSMIAEKAIQSSGLSTSEFATMVQEKALERDLPVFQAYLREEDVEDILPFSEDNSIKFKGLIDEELE